MMDALVSKLKQAALGVDAEAQVKAVLSDFVREPAKANELVPNYTEDDVILFEDDSVSIWFCRFQPGTRVPPHDHRMSATIGVFKGTEQNIIFGAIEGEKERLLPISRHDVHAGEVFQIPEDGIHSVTCISQEASEAIHVYLGPLSQIDRALYDLEAGAALDFTDENYAALTKG